MTSKEKGQDIEGLWAGRRIIGQVAGHEIHLEIEDVQDKQKNTKEPNLPNPILDNYVEELSP